MATVHVHSMYTSEISFTENTKKSMVVTSVKNQDEEANMFIWELESK